MNDSDWVRCHQHIFLVGPTGIGKTFLARAFGQKACGDGFTACFATAAQLFRELELARADGSYAKKLRTLGQVDVLIVDDWVMAPLTDTERRAFLEICDERYLTRATLLTSQLPIAKWHAQIASRLPMGHSKSSSASSGCRKPEDCQRRKSSLPRPR
jgi:DNA replication protein DnaC